MVENENKHKVDDINRGRQRVPMGLIPIMAGCLTFALATIVILVGLWLDLRLGTTPRWTLILLIGSAPIALGGVYLIVRRSLRKMRAEQVLSAPDNISENK